MTPALVTTPILLAEDDMDDRFFVQKAFQENRVSNPFMTVNNGEELLDYLYRRGSFAALGPASAPCLILLDLKMPLLDGQEVLKVIKTDPKLKKIPVIILSTSKAQEDLMESYGAGANSYITKPSTFEGLVKIVRGVKDYWLGTVEPPPPVPGGL